MVMIDTEEEKTDHPFPLPQYFVRFSILYASGFVVANK